MDILVSIVVAILNHLPIVTAFFIPALIGLVFLREKGSAYRLKAALTFLLGFGAIVWIKLVFKSFSAVQTAEIIGLSAIQVSVALALAYVAVYRLAD